MALNLDHLEQLATKWKRLQPLQALHEERLWQKLRLEWNYHSNHIEGNTLTYGETAAYLLHNQTSGNHSGREYDEMKGHDLAVELVRNLGASPQDLTEVDVRNLNQIILKEPFYKDAVTADGKVSRKLITPGSYKEEPNSVRTSTGELFEYASPIDVPMRMAKLMEAIRNCVGHEGLAFMAALAITHHEFTLIHPFDDGNGRSARLLTNYVLLKKGLLPLVIPSEKKSDYLSALRQADGGNPTQLIEFLANHLIWSLEIGIKAAKGENLEEPSDIEKEIALFIREQKRGPQPILQKNPEVVHHFLTTSVHGLFEKIDEKTHDIATLFASREIVLTSDALTGDASWENGLEVLDANRRVQLPQQVTLTLNLKGFNKKADFPFDITQAIRVDLDEQEYRVDTGGPPHYCSHYSKELSATITDEIVRDLLRKLFHQLQERTKV